VQHELTWFTGGGEGRRGKPERREKKVCVLRPRGGAVEERRCAGEATEAATGGGSRRRGGERLGFGEAETVQTDSELWRGVG